MSKILNHPFNTFKPILHCSADFTPQTAHRIWMNEVHQTSRFIWLATHCCWPETRFNGLYIWGNLILKNANWEALNKDSHFLALPSPQWGTSWWHRSPWPAWRRGRTWSVSRWTVWSWDSSRSTGSRQPIHSSRPAAEKHQMSKRDMCKCLTITLHKPLQWFTIKQWVLKHICTLKSIKRQCYCKPIFIRLSQI